MRTGNKNLQKIHKQTNKKRKIKSNPNITLMIGIKSQRQKIEEIGAPQYVRQMLTSMKGEINNNTIIVGDFHTPLTPMDRSIKQKINKET